MLGRREAPTPKAGCFPQEAEPPPPPGMAVPS